MSNTPNLATPPNLHTRLAAHSWRDNYGNMKQEANTSEIQAFMDDSTKCNNRLVEYVNYLTRRIDDLKPMADLVGWIQAEHPDVIQGYKDAMTAKKVAARIEDSIHEYEEAQVQVSP